MENLSHFTKKGLDLALGRLSGRGFVKRGKKTTSKTKIYFYSITELGKRVYDLNNSEEMKEKMRNWLEINRRITSKQVGPRIGKTQSQILNLFKTKDSVFSSEVTSSLGRLNISKSSIQHALRLLIKNKFLFRRKEYNNESQYKNKFEFRYYSTPIPQEHEGNSYEGLGANLLLVLQILELSEGMFARELRARNELKDIPAKSIGNTLLKLVKRNFLVRVEKRDIGDNKIKYFYNITFEGRKFLSNIIGI